MADELNVRLERAEAELRRRRLFNHALSPELLDEIAEFLGVKDCLFAFQQKEDGAFDTLDAMRVDTLAGAVRALRLEASEKYLREQERHVELLKEEVSNG